jgi:hypothetical protein
MIEYLRRHYKVDRVAIVDTDCHHGDGTQDIYWHDPDTLFISLHQDGRTLYPGSGFLHEFGGPNAVGSTINIPLPPETCDEGFLHAIEHAVLPILDDFKPDLIINSAGQDNHYSDPITNMNFSARGYAKLTEMLKADIAVLEGGYSIEGALPYVNAGIIMAMAGIDYSNLQEPDNDPGSLQQSPRLSAEIQKVCDDAVKLWKNRDEIKKGVRNKSDCDSRNRQIFYDTDNITESQHEVIRICDDCAGALRIDSTANYATHILGIHIPRKACPACIKQGLEWYETADSNIYDHIFLQDRPNDNYHVK